MIFPNIFISEEIMEGMLPDFREEGLLGSAVG
jgi:hypothetical protein